MTWRTNPVRHDVHNCRPVLPSLHLAGQLVKFVSRGGRPPVPEAGALPGRDAAAFEGLGVYLALMERCWSQDPAQRPTFTEIVAALRWGRWSCRLAPSPFNGR